MNKILHISASLDQPEFLEDLVERLAYPRYESRYIKAWVPKPWQAIETSTTETYISGTVEIAFNEAESIRMPFITCFVFVCKKGKDDPYKVNWSLSFN